MAEFRTEYYTPMDRAYHEHGPEPRANIEEPIIPISQLGQTVPEIDPTGRMKNILQSVQAAIRGGTGNLQIVFQTPLDSPIGGRPKAYGEEVRRALKEVAMANEVLVTGMEMPTSLTNLSGFDPQRGIVDEEKRQRDLDEVKEMIKFAADVGQGGGVDIVSFEYDRPIHRAKWFQEDSKEAKAFRRLAEEEAHKEEVRFVDTRSGQIGSIPIREGIPMFMKKVNGKYVEIDPTARDEKTGELPKPQLWKYKEFKEFAEAKGMDVHEAIKRHFLEEQLKVAKAQSGYYHERYSDAMEAHQQFDQVLKIIDRGQAPPEEMLRRLPEEIRNDPSKLKNHFKEKSKFYAELADSFKSGLEEQRRVELQTEQRIEAWRPIEEVTLQRTQKSYAEAGITAMQTQDKMGRKNMKEDIYVGPELGWPQFYGSHPKEFVETIKGARKQMVEVLTDSKKCREFGLTSPLSRSEAEAEAKKHIKGCLDTSHFGMWLQNFHPEMPWDKRVKEFNKWYKEQMEWLAEENKKGQFIGAIQAVDSAGAGHGHLPPGQGIFPVKETVEMLKLKGKFDGYVTSEGHEEEKFGEGRIALKTWQHFNAPISSSYGPGPAPGGRRWGEIQNAYLGKTYSPMFMFGAYAPSNEFKLWSEIPLE
jgi:sugar phosphate isomerase/epimerase